MRQTIEGVERYLEKWEHISGREFQDPDQRRRAIYEAWSKALMRKCLNTGFSIAVTDALGGQDVSLMELGDGSEAWVTDGKSMGRYSFWEFYLRGFLRYGIPFQRIAFGIQEGIGSFFLHHQTGGVSETDVFLAGKQVTDISQWLERSSGELPRRFTVLGSFREGFRLLSGRLKISDPVKAQAELERMENFQPVTTTAGRR